MRRRLEVRGVARGVTVYDDFAHHPTAIRLTIDALRESAGAGRLVVAFEPRSNTMKLGVHRDALKPAFDGADALFVLAPPAMDWDLGEALEGAAPELQVHDDVSSLHAALLASLAPGDRVVLMSNGGFGGLRERIAASIGEAAA